MKNFIVLGVLLLFVSLAFQSCSTDSEVISIPTLEESTTTSTTTSDNLRRKKHPCGNTGGEVIAHITTEVGCNGYGLIWHNGRCWACW